MLRNSGRVSWKSMLRQLPQQVDLQRLLPIQRCNPIVADFACRSKSRTFRIKFHEQRSMQRSRSRRLRTILAPSHHTSDYPTIEQLQSLRLSPRTVVHLSVAGSLL